MTPEKGLGVYQGLGTTLGQIWLTTQTWRSFWENETCWTYLHHQWESPSRNKAMRPSAIITTAYKRLKEGGQSPGGFNCKFNEIGKTGSGIPPSWLVREKNRRAQTESFQYGATLTPKVKGDVIKGDHQKFHSRIQKSTDQIIWNKTHKIIVNNIWKKSAPNNTIDIWVI